MIRDAGRHALRIFVGVLCFGLTGCFDFEQHLTLKSNGAGVLEVMLRMDPAFQGALEDETLLGEQAAPVEVTREVRDGQYVQEEKVSFNTLSELRLQSETLTVVNNGATLFGVGPKNLTLLRTLENEGADPGAFGLMDGLFKDRFYTFKVTLPGWVTKAHPIAIGDEAIEAERSGSTVSWTIPMSDALSTPEITFQIDFLAYMDIDGNLTAAQADSALVNLAPGLNVYPAE